MPPPLWALVCTWVQQEAFAQEVCEAGANTTLLTRLGILVPRAEVGRVCVRSVGRWRTEVSPLEKACWQRPVR